MSCVCVCETELPAECKHGPEFGPAPSRQQALMLGRISVRASCQSAEMLSFPMRVEAMEFALPFPES